MKYYHINRLKVCLTYVGSAFESLLCREVLDNLVFLHKKLLRGKCPQLTDTAFCKG